MVTPTDRPTDQPGEYRAICLFESKKIEKGRNLQFTVWEVELFHDVPIQKTCLNTGQTCHTGSTYLWNFRQKSACSWPPTPLPPSSPPSAGQFLSFLPLESQCPTHPVSYSLTDLTFPRRFLKDNVPLEILLSLKYFFWFQSLSGLEDERCLPPRGSSCHCPFRCCLLGSCSFSILLKSHTWIGNHIIRGFLKTEWSGLMINWIFSF